MEIDGKGGVIMKKFLQNLSSFFQAEKFRFAKSFHDSEKKICTPADFKRFLVIERRRTERLNYNSSIIIFNLKNLLKNNICLKKFNIKVLLNIICSSIRETDEICVYENHKILILLPDTNNKGSQHVCEKIVEHINCYLPDIKMTFNDFNMEIISYPNQESDEKLPREFVTKKSSEKINDTENKTYPVRDTSTTLTYHHFASQNLSVATVNGSALALQFIDNFFWDQYAVSHFLRSLRKKIKRGIDLIGSILLLILVSPLMIIIALLIKYISPGPILFKQQRVGFKGKYFTFLKFRSMYHNCQSGEHINYMKKYINGNNGSLNNGSLKDPVFKMKNDSRITSIGKILRKTSLDELPQLLNVLTGDMSLVGPRPPIYYEVNEYKNWHYRRMLEVKPGITGLWQVSGRNKTTFDEMVRLDIKYIHNWSLFLDLKILLKTIKAVLLAEGI